MSEKPILFSGPMIIALLAGTKTQTRRIVKPQPGDEYTAGFKGSLDADGDWVWRNGPLPMAAAKNKYGQAGNRLYVKETHAWADMLIDGLDRDDPVVVAYQADSQILRHEKDNICDESDPSWNLQHDCIKWRPSIFMPRWASRITLEIVSVGVERLQDISEEDAVAEGCFFTDYGRECLHVGQGNINTCPADPEHHPKLPGWFYRKTNSHGECLNTARSAYVNLWESINGKGSWAQNYWVWKITFRKLETK